MTELVREIAGDSLCEPASFLRDVVEPCQPLVLRGLVSNWPVVQAGLRSAQTFRDHIAAFDTGGTIEAFIGSSVNAGKYYYNPDLKGFNFERHRMSVTAVLDAIMTGSGPAIYTGSVPATEFLPGFAARNPMPLLGSAISPRLWIGHAANISAHYDALDNLACVVAGQRRFTLFQPELIDRLYVGPIDNTMAGQPVSLAAAASPSDERKYPLFDRDLAYTAQLQAGDALYLPKLWWHQVESTAPFNGLVNYWWDAFGSGPDAPYTAMLLSMITLAERPLQERRAWKAFFEHYVFREKGHPLTHLPAEQRGLLGPLQPQNYGRIRARIMQLLRNI